MVDAVGVRLADGGSDGLIALGMGFGEVVSGTNDEPGFLEMWVYSSVSAGSGALRARIRGNDSCRGRKKDVKRKADDVLVVVVCSDTTGEGLSSVGEETGERSAVVSRTGGGEELPGLLR